MASVLLTFGLLVFAGVQSVALWRQREVMEGQKGEMAKQLQAMEKQRDEMAQQRQVMIDQRLEMAGQRNEMVRARESEVRPYVHVTRAYTLTHDPMGHPPF